MNSWTYLFVTAVVAGLALQLWLSARQAAHNIRAHTDRVPEAFVDRISLADHQKAAAYSWPG